MRLHQLIEEGKEVVNEPNDSYQTNIETDTVKNTNYRKVLHTTKMTQLVLMNLKPGEEIGEEIHDDGDQFIRIEEGEGKSVLDGKSKKLTSGSAVVVAAGTKHNIVNTSDTEDMKLYTVYAPPRHPDGVIEKTKADEKEEE